MSSDDSKQAHHRRILAAHKAELDKLAEQGKPRIPVEQFNIIHHDIQQFETDCPDLAPVLDRRLIRVVPIGNQTKVEIAALGSHLSRVIATLDSSLGPPPVSARTNRGFLSHAASDYALAGHLRAALEDGAPGVEYFLASHRGHIPPGDSWCSPIFENLRRADRFLILLTPASVSSLWIAFETGVGWASQDHPVVPLCIGIDAKDVPTPFAELQLLFLDGARGRDALLEAFERLGSRPPRDGEAFLARAQLLAETCAIDGLRDQGWTGKRVGDRFLAWSGPFDDLSDQAGIRLPKSDLDSFIASVQGEGGHVAFVAGDRLGSGNARQVFSISPKGWKRVIHGDEEHLVLVVGFDTDT